MQTDFHPEALAEIAESVEYYRESRTGRESRFLARLTEALELLEEHPEAAPVWAEHRTATLVRRLGVRHFPYGVFYFVNGEQIVVVAVAHSRRESGYWLVRLT